MSGLQTENAALHSRTSILEKVLDMRNEQIQVMQETKEVGTSVGRGMLCQRISDTVQNTHRC